MTGNLVDVEVGVVVGHAGNVVAPGHVLAVVGVAGITAEHFRTVDQPSAGNGLQQAQLDAHIADLPDHQLPDGPPHRIGSRGQGVGSAQRATQ